jgi:hypothetical protein
MKVAELKASPLCSCKFGPNAMKPEVARVSRPGKKNKVYLPSFPLNI